MKYEYFLIYLIISLMIITSNWIFLGMIKNENLIKEAYLINKIMFM